MNRSLARGSVLALAILAGSLAGASAQHHHGQTPAPAAHGAPKGDAGPASAAFHAANARMHTAMDIAFTGNVDVDFARAMIPHHQGAIDMAKVVLGFSANPAMRKLAEDIIKAQESEIAWMKQWLEQNAPR